MPTDPNPFRSPETAAERPDDAPDAASRESALRLGAAGYLVMAIVAGVYLLIRLLQLSVVANAIDYYQVLTLLDLGLFLGSLFPIGVLLGMALCAYAAPPGRARALAWVAIGLHAGQIGGRFALPRFLGFGIADEVLETVWQCLPVVGYASVTFFAVFTRGVSKSEGSGAGARLAENLAIAAIITGAASTVFVINAAITESVSLVIGSGLECSVLAMTVATSWVVRGALTRSLRALPASFEAEIPSA